MQNNKEIAVNPRPKSKLLINITWKKRNLENHKQIVGNEGSKINRQMAEKRQIDRLDRYIIDRQIDYRHIYLSDFFHTFQFGF